MCVCMYVYIYIIMYIYNYVYIYNCVYVYIYNYVYIYICIIMYIYIYINQQQWEIYQHQWHDSTRVQVSSGQDPATCDKFWQLGAVLIPGQ